MTIEERFGKMERELERQKRRNRWLPGVVLVLVGGFIAPALFKTTPLQAREQVPGAVKEIRAKSIVLDDENGKTRAMLRVGKDGPSLELFDENRKPRATLFVSKTGPALGLSDENGKTRVLLAMVKDGGSSLMMCDENSVGRVSLFMGKDGYPGLDLFDENFNPRAMLAVGKDGPSLGLSDENGKTLLGVGKDGPSLGLIDENRKPRAGLFVSKDGYPSLALIDENGISRFVAGKTETITPEGKTIAYPESSLVLFGPDGKVIWSAIK